MTRGRATSDARGEEMSVVATNGTGLWVQRALKPTVIEVVRPAPASYAPDVLAELIPHSIRSLVESDEQKGIPALAKDLDVMRQLERIAQQDVRTSHQLVRGDARSMGAIPDESVHLVLTSPPYWTLKEYRRGEGQLGHIEDYDEFLQQLDEVWRQCLRVLVPGGRLVVIVGDVCLSRRRHGRHVVYPLHASIQEHCRALGFDNLAPIIWHKISNAQFEAEGSGGGFLGKPYEPNAVIKNDIEFILFQRKPGGYRQPSLSARILSAIPDDRHKEWFRQIWTVSGASTRQHPAPFPVEVAERLVRMFSFVGDTVLDPFVGTGTTSLAAARWGRSSVAFEVDEAYVDLAYSRLASAGLDLEVIDAGR